MFKDILFALRLLWKTKFFTGAALLTLALCIGGNTAIFSMLNSLILRSLPFHEADRIVEVYNMYPNTSLDRGSSNIPLLLDYRENTEAFFDLALVTGYAANYGELGSPQRINGNRVTDAFFRVLRVNPEVGTFFTEEEMVQGQHRVVVLAHKFWKNAYGSDPNVVGQTMHLNGQPFTIRGVAPRSLEALFPESRLFIPLAWNPEQVNPMGRHGNGPRLYGRLKDDVSIDQAIAQIAHRDRVFYDAYPAIHDFLDRAGHYSTINGLQAERVKNVESNLYLLQIGALVVLTIGCVNIANLLLIRSNARQSEFAIRCAIGAKPTVIARQLITESLLLSIGGSIIGASFGWVGIQLINAYAMDMLPPTQTLAMDLNTLGFTLVMAVLTGLLVGALPALRVFKLNLVKGLSHDSRGSSSSRSSQLVSSALVCSQVSLALILLVAAGLLFHSFAKILSEDFGFEPEDVTTMRVSLSGQKYNEPGTVHAFQNQLLETIRALPEVSYAGISAHIPMTSGYPYNTFRIYGYEMAEGEDQLAALHTWASPGYFEALEIKILEGEGFGLTDVADGRRSVIIDKAMADRYYPDESPIGRKLGFTGNNTPEEEWPFVIGIAETVQHSRIGGVEGAPFIYDNIYRGPFRNFSIIIKSQMDYDALLAVVKSRVAELDPSLPLFQNGLLTDFIDDSFNDRRALMLLLGIFAGIAVALSAIGIYGVLAYSVSQQFREIGTRSAMGASSQQIRNLFLKRGLIKTAIGLGIGLVGAFILSRFITSMLYEVEPTDLKVYGMITLLLFTISMLASYLPARKASRIPPMEALRME